MTFIKIAISDPPAAEERVWYEADFDCIRFRSGCRLLLRSDWGTDMKNIVLDFSGIKSMYDLHTYLKKAFLLPDYYGYNMDALWDCLHCSFVKPTMITLNHLSALPKEMNEAVAIMKELFLDLEKQDSEVTIRILESGKETPSGDKEFMI